MIKFYFFLFLSFFSCAASEEDLEKMKQEIEKLQIEMLQLRKDNLASLTLVEQLDRSFKKNQTQIDNVTKENTELRQDIRALNQDMHALQNKKTETSTLNKIATISVITVCVVIAFVFFRFYYQAFQ